jgi:hypothetical protein
VPSPQKKPIIHAVQLPPRGQPVSGGTQTNAQQPKNSSASTPAKPAPQKNAQAKKAE